MSTSSGQAAVGRVRPKAKLVGSRWATAGPRSAVVHGRARDVRLPRNGCRVYRTRYPCCYMLHKMIEGTLHLSRAAGIGLTMLETAEVRMARGATQPLIHPYPKSGLNGKFSGPYAVATAKDRGRKRRSPSPPSEPGVQFSRDGLSSQLFPHRDWRANRRASDIVNSPRLAKKAFGHRV